MTSKKLFENHFSRQTLISTYRESVALSHATGIDNLTQKNFNPTLENQIEIILKKTSLEKYIFTRYKLKLISKGRGKFPREISIPTIRDRLVLKSLCNFLLESHRESITLELPQIMIKRVKSSIESKRYDGFIKIDVENFYPSIDHEKLISRLRAKIRYEPALTLIRNAISTPTVSTTHETCKNNTTGVPQGLSISNILAAIFLSNLDKKYKNMENLEYYRYVDDVFILCDKKDIPSISLELLKSCQKLKIRAHPPQTNGEKSTFGTLESGFNYLGYYFHGNRITVREASVRKIKESLVSIFSSYKHSREKSVGFLQLRINLRVTGCVFKEKGKGWLFFFSEINDDTLLYNLDNYLRKLKKRFNTEFKEKKFSRAFY